MVECPKCGESLTDSKIDLDVYIKGVKIGMLNDVLAVSCTVCGFDAIVLQIDVTEKGIFIEQEGSDGRLN
ncbi:MAG TPA: hypothetical protein PLB70_03440 [Paludibacteraceae bacterium]|nr:hypothetical protein [Paludibacteraceae bacterium]